MTANKLLTYFVTKAKVQGVIYIPKKYKDKAVLQYLLDTYDYKFIIRLIDFIWEGNGQYYTKEGIMHKAKYGVFMLSEKWLPYIVSDMQVWEDSNVEATYKRKVKKVAGEGKLLD